MVPLLLVGFAMIAVSVWFWYMELRPFLNHIQKKRKWWIAPFAYIGALPKLFPFVLDLGITFFCVANLGFGGGVIGGISGLFLSNVVSCFILHHQRKGMRKLSYA